MTLSIRTRLLSCIALVATLVPMGVGGQSWKSVNALGYGGTGTAVALALVDVDDCTDEGLGCLLLKIPLTIGAGWATGMTVGTVIGESADRSLASGESLGNLHLAAIAGGTVLAGATAGVVAAGTVVATAGSPVAFADLATILSIAGAGVGLVHLNRRWSEFTDGRPEAVRLTPAFSPEQGAGLVATVRF